MRVCRSVCRLPSRLPLCWPLTLNPATCTSTLLLWPQASAALPMASAASVVTTAAPAARASLVTVRHPCPPPFLALRVISAAVPAGVAVSGPGSSAARLRTLGPTVPACAKATSLALRHRLCHRQGEPGLVSVRQQCFPTWVLLHVLGSCLPHGRAASPSPC